MRELEIGNVKMKSNSTNGSVPRVTIKIRTQEANRIRQGDDADNSAPGTGGTQTLSTASGQQMQASSAASGSHTAHFRRGEQLFARDTGHGIVYIVRAGCIRIYKVLPDRRQITLALLGPNTLFAQEDSSNRIATGAVAEALTDATVAMVAAGALVNIVENSPQLAAAIVNGMTRRLTELQTLVEQLLIRDTTVRLATTLLTLADLFGKRTTDGLTTIAFPVTHQTLANLIGANRVTVTRRIRELQDQGLVRPIGRNALAVDAGPLRHYVQSAGTASN
jgi:CRP-like cAMP-binding protein